MKRVTGIGGIFFKSEKAEETGAWYKKHLGLGVPFDAFLWKDDKGKTGYSVWSVFKNDTEYFQPSDSPFMVNFRVENLETLLETLRDEGVEVVGDIAHEANGKFGWILDPEGRKLELWEPINPDEDPYLPT